MTKLSLHETLEVHELLTFKNLCLTKSTTMSGMVQDEELRSLLNADVEAGQRHIEQLKEFLADEVQ